LRGFAILVVVLFHIYMKTHFVFAGSLFGWQFDAHTFVEAGYLGVEIFFFVSGFCLMLPFAVWLVGRRPKQTWPEYVSRRFWKIVPSYYLALAVVVFFYPFQAQPGIAPATDALLHAVFLHGFNALSFSSLNAGYWSLAVEVEFYVVFPLLVWGFARSPIVATVATTLLGLGYSWYIAAHNLDGVFQFAYQLPSFLPLFAIGGLCAWVHERWIRGATLARTTQLELGVVALASVAALAYVFEQANRGGGGPASWGWENGHRLEIAVVLAAFTLAAACATPFAQACIANRPLAFLSDISYNMYLWNGAIIDWMGRHWTPNAWWAPTVPFSALAFVLTVLFGWAITRAFERPLMRARFEPIARLFRRRPASTTTAP